MTAELVILDNNSPETYREMAAKRIKQFIVSVSVLVLAIFAFQPRHSRSFTDIHRYRTERLR